jgi:DNA replication protein DnaC
MSPLIPPHPLDLDGMLKRLHLPTIRRLYHELEERAEQEQLGYAEYLAILIAEEVAHRGQTRVERAVRKAKFPFVGTIEDFDFTFQTSVRRQLLGSFLGPELVSEARSLILSGPTGTGKTRLAISIAYRAIQNGFEARFTTAASLIEELSNAARTGRLSPALHSYTHPHVLVIDEVGYLTLKDNAANVLFQVVNERYLSRKPMLFTTNKPLAAWGIVLHDPDLAEALLDRVLERGRHIELRGTSYRTRHTSRKEETSEAASRDPGARISGRKRAEFPEPTLDPDVACEALAVVREEPPLHALGPVLACVRRRIMPATARVDVLARRHGGVVRGRDLARHGGVDVAYRTVNRMGELVNEDVLAPVARAGITQQVLLRTDGMHEVRGVIVDQFDRPARRRPQPLPLRTSLLRTRPCLRLRPALCLQRRRTDTGDDRHGRTGQNPGPHRSSW